ncbi:hypothetical protein VPHD386_0159 [Vibrio phage D386]
MKFNITMDEVIEATWQAVNGTCKSGNILEALPEGVYELLANKYSKETRTFLGYEIAKVDALSIKLAKIFEERGFEDLFWNKMAGTGNDHCPACGWWDEDIINSPDDYVDPPITEGCMCNDCAEYLEEK